MYHLQKLGKTAPRITSLLMQQQQRNGGCLASKPRVRIPFAEKIGLGLTFVIVPLLVPLYCATQINNWRTSKEA